MTSSVDQEQFTDWLEVVVLAPQPQAEAVADFLTQLTGRGVQMGEFTDPPGPVEVVGFLASGPELMAQKTSLERYLDDLRQCCQEGEILLSFRNLPDQDWGQNWKKHFKPRAVTSSLVVAPPWEPAQPLPGQKVIIIDPGQAFGTGQHESSLLCLRRLESLAAGGELPPRLLDLGCGTGILALAGLLLGAQSALALDLDPLAVEATLHNARLNKLEDRLQTSTTPLDQIQESFPLILANLTAKDLMELAPQIKAHLSPGGELVASGMLVRQVPEVRRAFEDLGLAMLEQGSLAGWASLVLT